MGNSTAYLSLALTKSTRNKRMAPNVGSGGTSSFNAYLKIKFSSKCGAGMYLRLSMVNLFTLLISSSLAHYTQVNSVTIDSSSDIRASPKIESSGPGNGEDFGKIPSLARKMKIIYGAETFLKMYGLRMRMQLRHYTTPKSLNLAAHSNGSLPRRKETMTVCEQ